MRTLLVMIALLLYTAGGFTAEKNISQESQKSPQTSPVKKAPEQKVAKEKKSPEWPRPYKSTEEISVDSIVPFPTDI